MYDVSAGKLGLKPNNDEVFFFLLLVSYDSSTHAF